MATQPRTGEVEMMRSTHVCSTKAALLLPPLPSATLGLQHFKGKAGMVAFEAPQIWMGQTVAMPAGQASSVPLTLQARRSEIVVDDGMGALRGLAVALTVYLCVAAAGLGSLMAWHFLR